MTEIENKTCQHRIQYVDFIDGRREMRCKLCRAPWAEVEREASKQKRQRQALEELKAAARNVLTKKSKRKP